MKYSEETIKVALDADNQNGKLHRFVMWVDEKGELVDPKLVPYYDVEIGDEACRLLERQRCREELAKDNFLDR